MAVVAVKKNEDLTRCLPNATEMDPKIPFFSVSSQHGRVLAKFVIIVSFIVQNKRQQRKLR